VPFFKKSSSKPTRLFFATDLHASERAFRKFINAGKFYNADVLVMGGDVVGKLVVPILRGSNGRYHATFGDLTHEVETQAELGKLQEQLGMMGYYFRVMDEAEFRALEHDRVAVEALFHELARERLTQWVEFAETRLKETNVKCYVMGGNDDAPDILQVLQDTKSEFFIACEDRVVELDAQHTMISLGYSTPTPWHTAREITDAALGEKIEALVRQVPDVARCVFNLHDPPKESSLDLCAMVQEGDPPRHILKAGQPVMQSAGSVSVRRAIETHQPLLSLHGHIHESPGVIRIGRTLCVNPGSEYSEGILRGMIAILQDGKLQGHQLTAG
jgi:uncharacterized protein